MRRFGRFGMIALAAVMLLGSVSLGAYGYTRISDAPACCQNHESCCPGSSCCSGSHSGYCPMRMHAHHPHA